MGLGTSGIGGAAGGAGLPGSGGTLNPSGNLYGGLYGGGGYIGGDGAVRIIWGKNRSYPSSLTANVTTYP